MSDIITIKSIFREYNVHFISNFSSILSDLNSKNAFFIVDKQIWEIYQNRIKNEITNDRLLIIEAIEKHKSLDKCREIIKSLVDKQFRKNDKLVAIGGGIIQDVTAFSASIIYRGVEWTSLPTTLLAQGDSCIGSKTSINLDDKKNLIGNFYPPSDIFIDTTFLNSLTIDDIKSGIGEMIHYYLYAASPSFKNIITDYAMIIRDVKLLEQYIRESLLIKKSVIENDEFDRGERNKFNYGHTFGHALESVSDYVIKHGQAVTVGMDIANYISMKKGYMKPDIFNELHSKLLINFPEYDWNGIDFDYYFSLLTKDKKNIGTNIGCILAKETGILFKVQLPLDDTFKKLITTYFSKQLLSI